MPHHPNPTAPLLALRHVHHAGDLTFVLRFLAHHDPHPLEAAVLDWDAAPAARVRVLR